MLHHHIQNGTVKLHSLRKAMQPFSGFGTRLPGFILLHSLIYHCPDVFQASCRVYNVRALAIWVQPGRELELGLCKGILNQITNIKINTYQNSNS